MLDKECPDLLHIVTTPDLRVPLMTIAAEHEVPVAIVEKPIAIQGEDWRQIRDLREKCKTRFVVNTQLHFHARNLELKRDVAEGRIGEIRFIDVSARSTIRPLPVIICLVSVDVAGLHPICLNISASIMAFTSFLCSLKITVSGFPALPFIPRPNDTTLKQARQQKTRITLR